MSLSMFSWHWGFFLWAPPTLPWRCEVPNNSEQSVQFKRSVMKNTGLPDTLKTVTWSELIFKAEKQEDNFGSHKQRTIQYIFRKVMCSQCKPLKHSRNSHSPKTHSPALVLELDIQIPSCSYFPPRNLPVLLWSVLQWGLFRHEFKPVENLY